MSGRIDWESQIGRRLKLRDLHVFCTVVRRGSMAKAASHLGVSQPAVSEVVADLEHMLGFRLLDRRPHGIEPTIYGRALVKRSTIVFDELKQGINDIECLADPASGEVRIGCAEAFASAALPPIIQHFSQAHPRVFLHLKPLVTPTLDFPELRARSLDVVLARIVRPLANEDDDLNVETLFDDHSVVAAGLQTRWARRQKVDLAELADEPWVLAPPAGWNGRIVEEAFRARGLAMPKIYLTTYSIQLRATLLATGPFISAFPASILRLKANEMSLKILPVELPFRPWPFAAVTLKNRTLNPAVARFIDHVRTFTRSMTAEFAQKEYA
jgi:DNA-binding transcriptional LysR family regulator